MFIAGGLSVAICLNLEANRISRTRTTEKVNTKIINQQCYRMKLNKQTAEIQGGSNMTGTNCD